MDRCVSHWGHRYGDRHRPNDQAGLRCMHCGAPRAVDPTRIPCLVHSCHYFAHACPYPAHKAKWRRALLWLAGDR